MKIAAFIAVIGLAASVAEAGVAGRFRPATPDYVVLRVPARATNDPIAMLEARYAQARSEATATELAQLYLERARASRETRYFARAEALVQPWVKRADARGATLRVQADILQNRHEFSGALQLLDRAVVRDSRDAGSRLMRASVQMVQGRAAEARSDCAAVLASGESAAGTICLAQVLGATGGVARGEALIKGLLSRGSLPPTVRGWALGLLADFADRAGDSASAETYLRAALDAVPENEGIRSALSDLLLSRGALREAMAVVDLPSPSAGLLARRAHAQVLLRDGAVAETHEQIDALIELAARRGDPPHLREEALMALNVDRDPARALTLARANFETQRETLDVRLLARAARASGNREALREVADWVRETGFEDHELAGGRP
jgi:thioredoxin-like negative regulator of GroEL